MVELIHIRPQRLTKIDIWKKAENSRNKYVSPIDKTPVPIIEIVEINIQNIEGESRRDNHEHLHLMNLLQPTLRAVR
ncbi:MAG: hypothetical protein KAW56_09705 [Candidatus Marinimicrobia bacterium]|nr:hypothetical protein [Candidatus Neomarinimicrobiota bacterium]